jgi:hypothetical protein
LAPFYDNYTLLCIGNQKIKGLLSKFCLVVDFIGYNQIKFATRQNLLPHLSYRFRRDLAVFAQVAIVSIDGYE